MNAAADHVEIPGQQIEPRKRHVWRADHHRQQKLPMVAGIDGTRKNHTMMMP